MVRPEADLEKFLAGELPGCIGRTILERGRLRRGLQKIRRAGWAMDHGEYTSSVDAVAAPILDGYGKAVVALGVPFRSDNDPAQAEKVRVGVIAPAAPISALIPVGRLLSRNSS